MKIIINSMTGYYYDKDSSNQSTAKQKKKKDVSFNDVLKKEMEKNVSRKSNRC